MTYVDWRIKGPQLSTCNCNVGCPCQFNALPTYGDCRAAVAVRIDEAHFGGVSLAGLHWAVMAAWSGAIHEGNGECLPVVEERADENQGEARADDPVPLGWSGGHAHLCTMHMTPHGPGG